MTITVTELLASGHAIENPENSSEVILNIPIRVNKAIVQMGGLEMFAAVFNWEETIDGEPNPIDVVTKCQLIVKDYVKQIFDTAVRQPALRQANAQVDALLAQVV